MPAFRFVLTIKATRPPVAGSKTSRYSSHPESSPIPAVDCFSAQAKELPSAQTKNGRPMGGRFSLLKKLSCKEFRRPQAAEQSEIPSFPTACAWEMTLLAKDFPTILQKTEGNFSRSPSGKSGCAAFSTETYHIRFFFNSRMSSPKKWSTWYSPSRREAIWGEYRLAASSMDRLEEITVRRPPTSRLFTSS